MPRAMNPSPVTAESCRVKSGGTSSNAPAASNYGIPQPISDQHNILQLVANLKVFFVNPTFHSYHKSTVTAPFRSGIKCFLNSPMVAGPILSHHKVWCWRRRLQQLSVTGVGPTRKAMLISLRHK